MTTWSLESYDDVNVNFVSSTVDQGGRKKLYLDRAKFRSMLENSDLSGIPIVVVSVVGSVREGKSLLLHLIATYYRQQGWLDDSWLDTWNLPTERSYGMPSWSAGVESHTQGLIAYGAPLILARSDGKKIAVLLIDSEGVFDLSNSSTYDASLFTFCSYVSSLQIYNKMKTFNAIDMENLKFLVELAKECKPTEADNVEICREKTIFKDLCFLLRDWSHPQRFDYGSVGGGNYYNNVRTKMEGAGRSTIPDCIGRSYQDISCYLMPEPGPRIRNGGPADNGMTVADLGEDFYKHVREFMSTRLHPERLLERYAARMSQQICSSELIRLLESYGDSIFNGNIKAISTDPVHREVQRFRNEVTGELEKINAPNWKDYDNIMTDRILKAMESSKQTLNDVDRKDFWERLGDECAVLEKKFEKLRWEKCNGILLEAEREMKSLHGKWFTKSSKIKRLSENISERLQLDERDAADTKIKFQEILAKNLKEAEKQNIISGLKVAAVGVGAGVLVGATAGIGAFVIGPVAGAVAAAAGVSGGLAAAAVTSDEANSNVNHKLGGADDEASSDYNNTK